MAYVSSSVRNTALYGGDKGPVAFAGASAGQTRVMAAVIRTKTADFGTQTGWTNRLNVAHPDGQSRLGIWTKEVTGSESSGTLTMVTTGFGTDVINTLNVCTWVDDGTYKRIASTTDSNWITDHSTPSATTDSNDDTAYAVVAAGTYNRTWSSGSLTVVGNSTSSGGADIGMGYKTVTSSSTTGTLAMTANDTEQSVRATLVFAAAGGATTGDLIGSADTPSITSVAVTGGNVSVAVGATADRTVTVLGGGAGTTPVVGANVSLQLSMPSGAATVSQLAVTDAAGQATLRFTGTTATSPGQLGSFVASLAGKVSTSINVVVTASVGSNSLRIDELATTLVGGVDTPTTGWTAWVHALPTAADQVLGAHQFTSSNLSLVTNGRGGLRVDVPIPASVTATVGQTFRVLLRQSASVSPTVPTLEFGVLYGTVI